MIASTRLSSQQLANPMFNNPKELVSWMGAIQAQDYAMAKWAIGIRLQTGKLKSIEESLKKGEIIRTHVMRPTWHLIAAEDARWMLKLSAKRNKATYKSYLKGRNLVVTENEHYRCNCFIEKILEGNHHLTKQQLSEELEKAGFDTADHRGAYLISHAELEGIICSGIDSGKEMTYALLEERIPPMQDLTKEESLAKLAGKYFRSHSPASLQDFIWWSGLTASDAKQAIDSIQSELITEKFASQNLIIHKSYQEIDTAKDQIHLLPSFDEYLISYKNRTDVLPLEYQPKAFNTFGTFYPVIAYKGQIIGNWKKTIKRKEVVIKTSFFESSSAIKKTLIKNATNCYLHFLNNQFV